MSTESLIRSVAVFCGSSSQVDDKYYETARVLGCGIAESGWTLVYGGGGVGLMGALATAALAVKGKVIGVRPTFISDFEGDQMGLDEMIITETMHQRVQIILERSDAYVALPGSCGTLDELIQTVTWKKLDLHHKEVIVVNQDGYFDPLLAMFDRMVELRFVDPSYLDLYTVCPDADATLDALKSPRPNVRYRVA